MALRLDLQKSAAALKLSLTKAGVDISKLRAQVSFDLDVSGSYSDEHEGGQTTDLLNRLVPWGMVLDVNQEIDVFTFSDGERHVHHVGVVTPATVDGYVRREIINKVPGWCGGTDYSYVIEENLRHFGWLPKKAGGLFSRLTGGGAAQKPGEKSLILFNTDGANSDKDRTYRLLKESQDRKDLVYFLIVAYANGGADFRFLEKIAEDFSNVGLTIIRDIPQFVAQSDEQINQQLIGDELLTWLKA